MRETHSPLPKETPPNKEMKTPIVKVNLNNQVSKKSSEPSELSLIGKETISTYTGNITRVYTDGSAFKGTTNAGCGILIEYNATNHDEVSMPCGVHCSNYEAEALAIETALQKIRTFYQENPEKVENVVVFSDSKSVLDALENQNFQLGTIRDLALTIHSFLEDFEATLTLQWIPSHCNIPGNERADSLARSGAQKEQIDKPVSLSTAKQMIKSNSKIEWHNSWALCKKGRSIFRHLPKPNRNDSINFLKRKEQVIIFRLRSNHIPLNAHLNRITTNHPPNCALCDFEEESVDHFLFHCPALTDIRRQFLPKNPDLENTLYSTTTQLRQTYTFFEMANRRRTQV